MVSEFTSRYATAARFDYVKLTFPDIHPVHRRQVDDVVSFALGKVSEQFQGVELKLPEMTTLPPSPRKPNGLYIVEIYGLASELVHFLPRHWLEFLTYVHVKSYLLQPGGAGIDRPQELFEDTDGLLTLTVTKPGSAARTNAKAKEKLLRLGSRKSGTHFVIYGRPDEAVGLESRFRDEAVKEIAFECHELGERADIGDAGAWKMALYRWARKGAEKFTAECYRRGLDPHELGYPVNRAEMKAGDTYERRADLHERENRHYWGD